MAPLQNQRCCMWDDQPGGEPALACMQVLFDFPRDPSEYVRRAGRVSRGAGGSGVVSLLVLGRQVSAIAACTLPLVLGTSPGTGHAPDNYSRLLFCWD